MNNIKLSIITVSYNCEQDIQKTFLSLNAQLDCVDCTEIEYLVIDGMSKDNTLIYARNEMTYLKSIGLKTTLVSEPDAGIYDAMNKGLKRAKGEWVYMLNAGDLFNDSNVLSDVMKIFDASYDAVCGGALRVNEYFSEYWFPGDIEGIRKTMIFCHQAVFLRRDIPEHYYDTQFKFCADYDLLLRMYLNGRKFKIIERTITRYSLCGVTGTNAMVDAYKDIYLIRKSNNIADDGFREKVRYLMGSAKRRLIAHLPLKIRWRITELIHLLRKKS